jgi:outer membrane protein TolC
MMSAATLATGLSGCRHFARKCSDKEVSEILGEKDRCPAWKIENWHIYADPRARFADPTNPDRPPMPPDDPAAYCLSPNPQKPKHVGVARVEGKGYLDLLAAWDTENRAERESEKAKEEKAKEEEKQRKGKDATEEKAEGVKPTGVFGGISPEARAAMRTSITSSPEVPTPKTYLIKLEQAVELGMFNSREYQDRRENLYLTALPVTAERFSFAAQWFATEQAVYTYAGRLASGGGIGTGTIGGSGSGIAGGALGASTPSTNQWALNSNVGFAKLLPTGAVLLYRIANTTVFNLSSGASQTLNSVSTMSLDIAQPLLRGAGRAVTLEPLTTAERNLLYEIRSYARFRKEFFVAIAGGGGGSITGGSFQPQGVIAVATYQPGTGIGGSPLTPGFLPALPSGVLQVTEGTSGRIIGSQELSAPVSGFLGTTLQYAQIDIDKNNIANLQGFLKRFEALEEGGDISKLQVWTVEQQLLRGQTTLLTDEQQYFNQIDTFKLQLGLPTDLPLELDDAPLRPILQQYTRYEEVFQQLDAATEEATALQKREDVSAVREALRRIFTNAALSRGTRFREQIEKRWAEWEKLDRAGDHKAVKDRLKRYGDERQKLLDARAELELKGQDLSPAEAARLREVEFEIGLGEFELELRYYEEQRERRGTSPRAWKDIKDPEIRRRARINQFGDVYTAFVVVLTEARNERLQILKESWPKLPSLCVERKELLEGDVDEAYDLASRTALLNRLDLMNVRAQLVDSWRQIAIFANALLGTFNVDYNLSTSTPVNKPLAFGGSRNKHTLTLNTELPLVRINERNSYRAALIAYQRERRTLMLAEDFVLNAVRGDLRQLRLLADNYKIQQRQVELAYLTVESSLESLVQPSGAAITLGGTTGTTGGAGGGGGGLAGGGGGAAAAALTNQLLQAQSSLAIAQNNMLTLWVNYLSARYQLYRDLELMPLDSRGVWIDDNASCSTDSRQPGGPDLSAAPGREAVEPERIPGPKPNPVPPAKDGPMGN